MDVIYQKKNDKKKVEDPYFKFNRKLNPYCKPDDGVNWDSNYGKKLLRNKVK